MSHALFSSVQSLSCVRLFATPWTGARQGPCSSPTPGTCSNSCTSRWWCHPTISFSVVPFSSSLPSFPASGSFLMIQFSYFGSHFFFFLIMIRVILVAQLIKESACNAGDPDLIPGSGKFPWRRKWQPIPVFLPGKSHGQRSLAGYIGSQELDTT